VGVAYKPISSNLVQPAILGYILPSNPPLSFRALLSVTIEAIAGFFNGVVKKDDPPNRRA
jgi:hypothetical protein